MLQNKLHIFVARYTNYQSRASYHDICEPWLLLTRLQTNQSWNRIIFKMLNSFLQQRSAARAEAEGDDEDDLKAQEDQEFLETLQDSKDRNSGKESY